MRAAATIGELEVWVRDVLQLDKPLYSRVSSITIVAEENVCGWWAKVEGDFELAELVAIDDAVTGLQRTFFRQ